MNEFLAGAKITVIASTIVGGILALPYLKMTKTQKLLSVPSAVFMSYQLAAPVSAWVGLPEGAVGALMGLFGMSICSLIFEGIQKSDISFKFSDIAQFFRR